MRRPSRSGNGRDGRGEKEAQEFGAHLVFLDESGFLLLPTRTRTWAPTGQAPYRKHLSKPGKVSTIGALTVSPKRKHLALSLQFHTRNLTGLEVRALLQSLLRHLRGPVLLVWDRGTIHNRQEVADSSHPHPSIPMEYVPAYAPELNPAEYIWTQADRAVCHTAPEDWAELQALLGTSVDRLRSSQPLLWSCIYASDLPWTR
jgi:transposase